MSDNEEVESIGTPEEIEGERKISVGTQTSFSEDQEDKSEGSPGNVWTIDPTSLASSSSEASASESFAETCDEVLSLECKDSDNKCPVKVLSSDFSKLDTN